MTLVWEVALGGSLEELFLDEQGRVIVSASLVLIDPVEPRVTDRTWVIGPDGAIVKTLDGIANDPRGPGVVIEPWRYLVHELHLERVDADGQVVMRTPIDRAPFDALVREHPELTAWPQFPPKLCLTHDVATGRLLATAIGPPGVVAALELDGTVVWATLVGDLCCNTSVPLGDGTALHASSCSRRLSWLDRDGRVFRTRALPEHGTVLATSDGIIFATRDALRGLDPDGETRWVIDGLEDPRAVLHGGRLYVANGKPRRAKLALRAYEL